VTDGHTGDGSPAANDPEGSEAADLAADQETAAAGDQVAEDLAAMAGGFTQTTEEAISEAVALAQKFESERDELRDLAQRVQAEFENYRRRVDSQRDEQRERAAEDLVRDLLPILDTCAAAVDQGQEQVAPVRDQLLAVLAGKGLAEASESGVLFDPNIHEAVLHEEGDSPDGPVVVEVMRSGYLWHQRVLRPAMVKVRG